MRFLLVLVLSVTGCTSQPKRPRPEPSQVVIEVVYDLKNPDQIHHVEISPGALYEIRRNYRELAEWADER